MRRVAPQSFDRVLSSMCTEPHPAAREAAETFLAANPGDPETYQRVAALEDEVVTRLGELTGLADPHGYVTSGGTEANLQAVRAARNLARDEGDPGDSATDGTRVNVVAPESAHFSFRKAADVLNVELRLVPTDDDHRARVDAMRAAADDDTVLVVGVAGTTEYGRVDPVRELADVAAGADAHLHVDAAWGGFALPFTDRAWNFDHAAVDSLAVDPHKFGRAVVPAGGLLFRDRAALDALAVDTPYLESTSQATLGGTRSGAGVASAAAAIDALWPDGYREQFERSMANAERTADALADRGFDVTPPELPLVAASVPDDLFAGLRDRGWRVSRTAGGDLRIVCMPHVTRETLAAFLHDVDDLR